MNPPRCITMSADARRCPRRAGKRGGDIFVCGQHARLITMALLDDMLAPPTRRMLAFAHWETAREGQALIDRMYRKVAA